MNGVEIDMRIFRNYTQISQEPHEASEWVSERERALMKWMLNEHKIE